MVAEVIEIEEKALFMGTISKQKWWFPFTLDKDSNLEFMLFSSKFGRTAEILYNRNFF